MRTAKCKHTRKKAKQGKAGRRAKRELKCKKRRGTIVVGSEGKDNKTWDLNAESTCQLYPSRFDGERIYGQLGGTSVLQGTRRGTGTLILNSQCWARRAMNGEKGGKGIRNWWSIWNRHALPKGGITPSV